MISRSAIAIALAWLLLSACDDADRCKASPECAKQGKCSANQQGVCTVASNRDCQGSEACKLHGQCSAKEGACAVLADADCVAAEDCKKQEMCSAYRGNCVNLKTAIHSECAKTCTSEGLCVMQNNRCVAMSRQ